MDMQQKLTTRKIVLTALLAALTVVGSALRITLPISIGGNTAFHLGNIMCLLAGLLLGPWLGGLAAGLGSMIYDMMNPLYLASCWITLLTKGAMGVAAGLVMGNTRENRGYLRALIASIVGSVVYALLYIAKTYFYTGMFEKGMLPQEAAILVMGKLPATIFNAVVAVIFAPILAIAITKALKKSGVRLE